MHRRIAWEPRTRWRIGAAFILICVFPASLWSQGISLSQPTPNSTDQRFAEYNTTLTRAADALLLHGTLPASVSTIQTRIGEALDIIPLLNLDQRNQFLNSPGVRISAGRVDRWRPIIESMLQSYGVPTALAAVIQVERGGHTDALSPKGARGIWQLMPDTARRYGLTVNDFEDDRLDIEKSTRGAARYLSDLHLQFGNWPLALAAYNTGENNIQRAIDRSGSTDFNVLSSLALLPIETRNYVPAVLAIIQSNGLYPITGDTYVLAEEGLGSHSTTNKTHLSMKRVVPIAVGDRSKARMIRTNSSSTHSTNTHREPLTMEARDDKTHSR